MKFRVPGRWSEESVQEALAGAARIRVTESETQHISVV